MNLPCSCLIFSLALASALAVEKPTCAVMNFDAKAGISKDEAEILSERFAGEFGNLGRYRLISRSRMQDVLELQKFARSDNCSATQCAIEAGQLLNAQFMVYGLIGKVGDTWTVKAAMVSVESGAISDQASVDVEGTVDVLLTQGMRNLARKLAGMAVSESSSGRERRSESASATEQQWAVDLGDGVELELVWIPPGEFMMGSPVGEENRKNDETQHRVKLTGGFWIGKYEVTQEQWERVMLSNAKSASGGGNNPSHFKGARRPVEQVSWNDAQTFINKLNTERRTPNTDFRLPTEAEWEYACRAGTATQFHTGDSNSDLDRAGWFSGNSEQSTHEVGQKTANAYGLYDMHGNVWEWCRDWYGGGYEVSSATDPQGASSGSYRVLRGGSWRYAPRGCRSAFRYYNDPASAYDVSGFRVVCGR